MLHRIIGIDIGSYSVKVAIIERGLRTFQFTEFYERKIQYNNLLSSEEAQAIAIQGLIDDHNLHWDISCTNFTAQKVTSRLLTFPFGSQKKIDQTVKFEIESYIPFNPDDVVVDYVVIWNTKDASRVMVVYVQKKDLVKELSGLATVNVDPRYICVDGIELINLINLGMVPPEGSYAIIDAGHQKCTISICRGKQLGFIRAISLAGKAITEAIAKRLGVPIEEAERLKIEMGRLSSEGEEFMMDDITKEVTGAIKGIMDEFLLHLRQTFFAYKDSEGSPVEGVYLCGGTSRIPGFDRYLSDSLKLNVTYLNCSDFHFTHLDRADAHRHVIPQALSLALRGATGSGSEINLRKDEFVFKGDVEQIGGSLRHVGIIIGLIIFLALINFTTRYYSVKRQIDKMRQDVVTLVRQALPGTPARAIATPKTAMSLIKSKEGEVTDKMNQLKAMSGTSPLDILKEISTSLPPRNEFKLDITELNVANDRVTMAGIVGDFKAVDTLKQLFDKSQMFTNATTGDVGKGLKGEVKFKMSMDLKQAETAQEKEATTAKESAKTKESAKGKEGGRTKDPEKTKKE